MMSEKKMPMDSTMAEFWKVALMPPADAPPLGREAVHDPGPVR